MTGATFRLEPTLYLENPKDRAFVEGRTDRPYVFPFGLLALSDLFFGIVLLALGTGIVPVTFIREASGLQPVLVIFGLMSIPSSIFLTMYSRRFYTAGQLLEGRVTEAALIPSPHHSGRGQYIRRLAVQFTIPEGETVVALTKTGNVHKPLPPVGAQAAVLYVNRNAYRVL